MHRMPSPTEIRWLAILSAIALALPLCRAELFVGTAVVDVTPEKLPVIVNGGMLSRTIGEVNTPLNARAMVLSDGTEKIAIVVVDSCMMPRPLLDQAKQLASNQTQIPTDRMLISATHTHSAPSSLSCLGTEADPEYVPYLRLKLADAIVQANQRLIAAKVGWGSADAAEYTALRRWIRRRDRPAEDPFGNLTVCANMHAATQIDDVTGESGPEDPQLSMLSFQSLDGTPLALLTNFSMHYFGDQMLSADYFGLFCEGIRQEISRGRLPDQPDFLAIMSHGCSGDIWRREYRDPNFKSPTIEEYTQGLMQIALSAYRAIEYHQPASLAMSEARLSMAYRVPDKQRLEWAQRIVTGMGDRLPNDTTEVYAREQVILHERQTTEIVVQALRIGDIAIVTTPNETYALSGMKLKLQSPMPKTMVIELANGGDGYIPPPEQHRLGGYNTWAARSAGLEVTAEPRIVAACLQQLEKVCNKPRRSYKQFTGHATQIVAGLKPIAFYRLDEFQGPQAVDQSGNHRNAIYEPDVVYFLEGPNLEREGDAVELNRAVHMTGGRIVTNFSDIGQQYSVAAWVWNGLPKDSRPMLGWVFSRDYNFGTSKGGVHLGLSGAGKLVLCSGLQTQDELTNEVVSTEHEPIGRWHWNHVGLVRDGDHVSVYLNGSPVLETNLSSAVPASNIGYFGGRSDNVDNWEGRLDEIAVFDRSLSAMEMATLGAHTN